jgi:flagellar protein FlgJ
MNDIAGSLLAGGTQKQNKLHLPKSGSSREEIDKVAQEFESLFLSEMLNKLFEHIETDKLFGGGSAENIYRSWQVEHYAEHISQRTQNGIGIAEDVSKALLRLQEIAS